jgi:hypothetical protein
VQSQPAPRMSRSNPLPPARRAGTRVRYPHAFTTR